MNGADEVFTHQGTMSHKEIMERFKKVFGREMTAAERRSFFLDLPLGEESTES
jgi:hypothetical protein